MMHSTQAMRNKWRQTAQPGQSHENWDWNVSYFLQKYFPQKFQDIFSDLPSEKMCPFTILWNDFESFHYLRHDFENDFLRNFI